MVSTVVTAAQLYSIARLQAICEQRARFKVYFNGPDLPMSLALILKNLLSIIFTTWISNRDAQRPYEVEDFCLSLNSMILHTTMREVNKAYQMRLTSIYQTSQAH